jgi:hypothetical protein
MLNMGAIAKMLFTNREASPILGLGAELATVIII